MRSWRVQREALLCGRAGSGRCNMGIWRKEEECMCMECGLRGRNWMKLLKHVRETEVERENIGTSLDICLKAFPKSK